MTRLGSRWLWSWTVAANGSSTPVGRESRRAADAPSAVPVPAVASQSPPALTSLPPPAAKAACPAASGAAAVRGNASARASQKPATAASGEATRRGRVPPSSRQWADGGRAAASWCWRTASPGSRGPRRQWSTPVGVELGRRRPRATRSRARRVTPADARNDGCTGLAAGSSTSSSTAAAMPSRRTTMRRRRSARPAGTTTSSSSLASGTVPTICQSASQLWRGGSAGTKVASSPGPSTTRWNVAAPQAPSFPTPAKPPASRRSRSSRTWWAPARPTSSPVPRRDSRASSPWRQSSS